MSPLEHASRAEIDAYQNAALKQLLAYLQANSPFYQRRFAELGLEIADIRTTADLMRLPTTSKQDLQAHNWEFLCVPRRKVAEYCSTSGTLGRPVTIALTGNDLARLYHNEYLSFACAGGQPDDVYQLLLTLDRQFMAGIAYYGGILKSGASVIRMGPGNIAAQFDTIRELQPTVLVAVPSFVVALVAHAEATGFDLNASSVRRIICIGESIRDEQLQPNALARRITEAWDVRLHSTYASTEKQTAFTECSHGAGGHHQPELLIFETLDESGQPLPAGQFGELTITTLGVEGMPLLRYRTGDICTYYDTPCACGRTTRRLGPIVGRRQHLLKYKGTSLYPQAIFNVLNTFGEVAAYVVEARTSDLETDELEISVALAAGVDETAVLDRLRAALRAALRVLLPLRVQPLAQVLARQNPGDSRKPARFIDLRRPRPPFE
ncbi:AMP-binding protein [Hymenobacter sp. DH14]|uniref:AMP-binding protein n=1 Tax=Hymenobacter cyanobacteriorum TaxID=2926463 RepID=A0A9X1VGE8_9BACT|nr:AMP-binding protein [Hymenobacter cyanobacteriorum]MCI1186395.1 AMP-binding protein [Hymenobacter cyanobacteriorum]